MEVRRFSEPKDTAELDGRLRQRAVAGQERGQPEGGVLVLVRRKAFC